MARLTLDQANAIADKAIEKRRSSGGRPIAVAVLDAGGHLKVLKREDDASFFRPEIAFGKAWGAVAMGEPSRTLREKAQQNPNFMTALAVASGGKVVPNPGGVLIRDAKGAIMGAVGISGDTGDADEAFAVFGIEAVGLTADRGA